MKSSSLLRSCAAKEAPVQNDGAANDMTLRRFPRLLADSGVSYTVAPSTVSKHGSLCDIGGGGISFQSAEPFEGGTVLTMSFELQEGARLEVTGTLVAASRACENDRYRHRVRFTAITDEVRDKILAYVLETWRRMLLAEV